MLDLKWAAPPSCRITHACGAGVRVRVWVHEWSSNKGPEPGRQEGGRLHAVLWGDTQRQVWRRVLQLSLPAGAGPFLLCNFSRAP
uniref:Uncharacterized protein n=1 Tax=Prolemur simus TaxID=1328070 RepID=A0A8C8ZGY2_PROSS